MIHKYAMSLRKAKGDKHLRGHMQLFVPYINVVHALLQDEKLKQI